MACALWVAVWSGACAKEPSGTARVGRGGQIARIETREYRFSPGTIELQPGVLTITVYNRGAQAHTFTTEEPAVDVVVQPGQTRMVTLTVEQPTAFFCRFHEANGMKGMLCPRDSECRPQALP